jgi:hypothetical protein
MATQSRSPTLPFRLFGRRDGVRGQFLPTRKESRSCCSGSGFSRCVGSLIARHQHCSFPFTHFFCTSTLLLASAARARLWDLDFWLLAFGSRLSWLLHFLPVVLLLRVTVHVNIQVASQLCHDYDANSSSGTSFSVRLVFGISTRRLVGHRVWGFGVSISNSHRRKTTSECRLHLL